MSSLHSRQSSVLSRYSSYPSPLNFITTLTSSLLIIPLPPLSFPFFSSHSFISSTLDVFSPVLLYILFSVILPFSYLAFLISSSWLKQFAYSTSPLLLIASTFLFFTHLHFFFLLFLLFFLSSFSLFLSPLHPLFSSLFSFPILLSSSSRFVPHLLVLFIFLLSSSLSQYLILVFPAPLFTLLLFTSLLYSQASLFLFTHPLSLPFLLSFSSLLITNLFNHPIFSSSLPPAFFLYTKILFHLITSITLLFSPLFLIFPLSFHTIVTSFITSLTPFSHSLLLLFLSSLIHFTLITHLLSLPSSLLTILLNPMYGFFTLIGASKCVCLSARYDLMQNSTALFLCFIALSVALVIHGFIPALFRKDRIIHLQDLRDINDPTLHI